MRGPRARSSELHQQRAPVKVGENLCMAPSGRNRACKSTKRIIRVLFFELFQDFNFQVFQVQIQTITHLLYLTFQFACILQKDMCSTSTPYQLSSTFLLFVDPAVNGAPGTTAIRPRTTATAPRISRCPPSPRSSGHTEESAPWALTDTFQLGILGAA